jgi:hypothetical protein
VISPVCACGEYPWLYSTVPTVEGFFDHIEAVLRNDRSSEKDRATAVLFARLLRVASGGAAAP